MVPILRISKFAESTSLAYFRMSPDCKTAKTLRFLQLGSQEESPRSFHVLYPLFFYAILLADTLEMTANAKRTGVVKVIEPTPDAALFSNSPVAAPSTIRIRSCLQQRADPLVFTRKQQLFATAWSDIQSHWRPPPSPIVDPPDRPRRMDDYEPR